MDGCPALRSLRCARVVDVAVRAVCPLPGSTVRLSCVVVACVCCGPLDRQCSVVGRRGRRLRRAGLLACVWLPSAHSAADERTGGGRQAHWPHSASSAARTPAGGGGDNSEGSRSVAAPHTARQSVHLFIRHRLSVHGLRVELRRGLLVSLSSPRCAAVLWQCVLLCPLCCIRAVQSCCSRCCCGCVRAWLSTRSIQQRQSQQ